MNFLNLIVVAGRHLKNKTLIARSSLVDVRQADSTASIHNGIHAATLRNWCILEIENQESPALKRLMVGGGGRNFEVCFSSYGGGQ